MGLTDSAPGIAWRAVSSGFATDLHSRNWSIYGQWIGFATALVCIALGVVNLLHLSLIIIFAIICLVQGLLIIFLEMPFLLRICPITERFTQFVKTFHQNLPRAAFYIVNAAIQYGGIGIKATSLIAVAVLMTMVSACYFLAYLQKQEFMTSATLGGDAVAREVLA